MGHQHDPSRWPASNGANHDHQPAPHRHRQIGVPRRRSQHLKAHRVGAIEFGAKPASGIDPRHAKRCARRSPAQGGMSAKVRESGTGITSGIDTPSVSNANPNQAGARARRAPAPSGSASLDQRPDRRSRRLTGGPGQRYAHRPQVSPAAF